MGEQVGIPAIYQFAQLSYPQVDTYADLPSAVAFAGKVYLVLTTTGVWFVNRKRRGLWRSDGAVWTRMGIAPTKEDMGLGVADDVEFSNLKLGASAFIKWLSGVLTLQTDEVDTNTDVQIHGNGTGYGILRIYDEDNAEYLRIACAGGIASLRVLGTAPAGLKLQSDEPQDIKCWSGLASGNPYFYIYGYKTAIGVKFLKARVNSNGDSVIEAEQDLILPNLAGTGDRAVMADVNGKLSAP